MTSRATARRTTDRRTTTTTPRPAGATAPTVPPRPVSPGTAVDADLDVDAERDASGDLPAGLTVVHSDAASIEREEAERALEARDDGGLGARLERLERDLEEIRARLDEDDDEHLHYRDRGTQGLEYVDEQIAP